MFFDSNLFFTQISIRDFFLDSNLFVYTKLFFLTYIHLSFSQKRGEQPNGKCYALIAITFSSCTKINSSTLSQDELYEVNLLPTTRLEDARKWAFAQQEGLTARRLRIKPFRGLVCFSVRKCLSLKFRFKNSFPVRIFCNRKIIILNVYNFLIPKKEGNNLMESAMSYYSDYI